MSDNSLPNMDDNTFQFLLSQLDEIERNIRHNEEVHLSQEKFFLSLLGALVSIVAAVVTFNPPAESIFIVLSLSVVFFFVFIISVVFLVLQLERRIATYEWIKRAVRVRCFIIGWEREAAPKSRIAKFFDEEIRLLRLPHFWPVDGWGRHPLFKFSLFVYIIISSLLAGAMSFYVTHYLTCTLTCSLIAGAPIAVLIGLIEWYLIKNYLQGRDRSRTDV